VRRSNKTKRWLSFATFVVLAGASLPSEAGTLTFNGGTWSGFTGTATTYTVNNDAGGISPSLVLTSPSSGDNWTLGGTLSYSILWTPASVGDTPPANAIVDWNRSCILSAAGSGVGELLNGSTVLYEMDSTNNLLAGDAAILSDANVETAITLQSDGTYQALGTVTSDTLSTTYDTSTGTITSCQEFLSVANITGSS
jgi:hypothetical protein